MTQSTTMSLPFRHQVIEPTPVHPAPCPSWCADREHPLRHSFGPTSTSHWGPRHTLAVPGAGSGDVLLAVQLFRYDGYAATGETHLYVMGEEDSELDADGTDVFIGDLEALLNAVSAARHHVG